MYKRIKDLREDNDYTQKYISTILNCKRSTYANWENDDILIPLKKLDELTLLYNVTFSYILNLSDVHHIKYTIYPLDYELLIKNLLNLKKENNYSYRNIANYINTSISTCSRYHKNLLKIPVDKLILFSKLYNVDIDILCGKIKVTKKNGINRN